MALPVKPSDWQSIIASTGASLCTRLKLLLNNIGQYLYDYMSWMWQEDGELTDEAAEVISRKVSGIRPGTVMYMAVPQASIPSGYLLCDGRSLNSTNPAYTPLSEAIGTTWGGDGAPNFNIPNLLGDLPYGARNDTELGEETERAFLSHSAGIFAATETISQTFEGIYQWPYLVKTEDYNFADNTLRIPNDLTLQDLDVKLYLVVTRGDADEGYDVGQEIDVTNFQWTIWDSIFRTVERQAGGNYVYTEFNFQAVMFPYSNYHNVLQQDGYPGNIGEDFDEQQSHLGTPVRTDSLFNVTYNINEIIIQNKYPEYLMAFANETYGTGTTDQAQWPDIDCDLRVEITNRSLFDNAYSLLTTHGLTPVIKL
jgi:hypothetical protein